MPTQTFSSTQKQGGFLKADHQPDFLSYSHEISLGNSEKQSPLAAHFSDNKRIAKFAYLGDTSEPLNELNLSRQQTTTVFKSAGKLAAFKTKLELWWR